jgi:hypothetical protein
MNIRMDSGGDSLMKKEAFAPISTVFFWSIMTGKVFTT